MKNPLTKEIKKHDKRSKWTVDRDREMYFFSFAGINTDEVPLFFALIINKRKIIIETTLGGTGSRQTGVETWWKISKIYVPRDLKIEKEIVEVYLKEAIEAYDRGSKNNTIINSLNINILSAPIYVNGEVY